MFKNPIKVASHNDIAAKDRKKLKKDLSKAFDPDVVDQIFIRSQTLAVTKLQGSKIQIISDQDDPLFVDSTSKNDFFPTCKFLIVNLRFFSLEPIILLKLFQIWIYFQVYSNHSLHTSFMLLFIFLLVNKKINQDRISNSDKYTVSTTTQTLQKVYQ